MAKGSRHVPGALMLAIGAIIGWGLANAPVSRSVVRAHGGDRWGDSVLTTGPVLVGYNEGQKVQVSQDAIYYLDYPGGRLLATVPAYRQSFGPAKLIDSFAERDLVADFKIDVDNGHRPHFLMTTGALGAYSEGWAPLYVFETTTNQVAVYKVQPQAIGTSTQPKFELVQLRSLAPQGVPAPPQR